MWGNENPALSIVMVDLNNHPLQGKHFVLTYQVCCICHGTLKTLITE
jgi:hypothetical protein